MEVKEIPEEDGGAVLSFKYDLTEAEGRRGFRRHRLLESLPGNGGGSCFLDLLTVAPATRNLVMRLADIVLDHEDMTNPGLEIDIEAKPVFTPKDAGLRDSLIASLRVAAAYMSLEAQQKAQAER